MILISVPSIAFQYRAKFYLLVPGCFIAGLSAGPISISINTYVTMSAEMHAHSRGQSTDILLPKFYGILLLMKQTSEIWGNLITSTGNHLLLCYNSNYCIFTDPGEGKNNKDLFPSLQVFCINIYENFVFIIIIW